MVNSVRGSWTQISDAKYHFLFSNKMNILVQMRKNMREIALMALKFFLEFLPFVWSKSAKVRFPVLIKDKFTKSKSKEINAIYLTTTVSSNSSILASMYPSFIPSSTHKSTSLELTFNSAEMVAKEIVAWPLQTVAKVNRRIL